MAWITKNQGAARIETRDTPYLTDAMRARLRKDILPRYETGLGALMPTLHEVQHAYGWIPHQAMMEVARFLGVSPAEVFDTVTFYEEYWTKPKGKFLIQICRSIACEVCGHEALTDAVRNELGIEVGETTDDGMFTLIELECLGSCGTAPAALINETLHETLTPAGIVRALQDVRAQHVPGAH